LGSRITMTSANPSDNVAYHVVIEGLDPEAQQIALRHFTARSGGARPHDLSLYVSVTCSLAEIDVCLAWVASTVPGRFQGTHIKISIGTDLSWTELTNPTEIVDMSLRYGAEIRVFFASRKRS